MKGTVQGVDFLNFSVFQKHVKIASDKDGPPLRSRISKLSQGFCNGLPHCIGANRLLSGPRSKFARKIAKVILVLSWVRFLPQLANCLKRFQNGNAGLAGNRVIVESLGALLHIVRECRPLSPCERLMGFAFLTAIINSEEIVGFWGSSTFDPFSGAVCAFNARGRGKISASNRSNLVIIKAFTGVPSKIEEGKPWELMSHKNASRPTRCSICCRKRSSLPCAACSK